MAKVTDVYKWSKERGIRHKTEKILKNCNFEEK